MIQVYYIISFSQNDMHILSYVTKKTVKDMNIVLIILNIMIDYYYTTVHIYIYNIVEIVDQSDWDYHDR